MKFSDSKANFDKFWSDNIVKSYSYVMQSKDHWSGTFFSNKTYTDKAIKHYCYTALVLFNDLTRNILAFEDPLATQKYFNDAMTQVQKGLAEFNILHLESEIKNAIDVTVKRLNTIHNEFLFRIEHRTLYDLNHPSIRYEPFKECADDVSGTFFAMKM
ncbi:hypothetical protein [Legionella gresilensis]|uniref:hypothetical protein n=1 Tax=Legionella gresilensis TaxID=91823 RepID=UPI0013EF77A7|nr:hypothetical protein [Legionella gresilensis]